MRGRMKTAGSQSEETEEITEVKNVTREYKK